MAFYLIVNIISSSNSIEIRFLHSNRLHIDISNHNIFNLPEKHFLISSHSHTTRNSKSSSRRFKSLAFQSTCILGTEVSAFQLFNFSTATIIMSSDFVYYRKNIHRISKETLPISTQVIESKIPPSTVHHLFLPHHPFITILTAPIHSPQHRDRNYQPRTYSHQWRPHQQACSLGAANTPHSN